VILATPRRLPGIPLESASGVFGMSSVVTSAQICGRDRSQRQNSAAYVTRLYLLLPWRSQTGNSASGSEGYVDLRNTPSADVSRGGSVWLHRDFSSPPGFPPASCRLLKKAEPQDREEAAEPSRVGALRRRASIGRQREFRYRRKSSQGSTVREPYWRPPRRTRHPPARVALRQRLTFSHRPAVGPQGFRRTENMTKTVRPPR
jgi:hypothetical protein